MRVLVCGSRTYTNEKAVWDYLTTTMPDVVIHGAAPGADTIAAQWADAWDREAEAYPDRKSVV